MMKKLKIIIILLLLLFPLSVFPWQNKDENLKLLKLAQVFERIGEYDRALKIYRMLYEKEPNNPNYFLGYEKNMQNLKMFDELVAHYNEKLKNKPSDLNTLGQLGEAYYQWGKTEKADSVWNSLIEINPKRTVNYSFLSNSLIRNRLYDRAVDVLLEGRRSLNNDRLFEQELANLYFWKREYLKGVKEYSNFLKQNPKLYNLVESRILGIFPDEDFSDEDVESIANLLREEIESDNGNVHFHRLLANLYIKNRMYNLAFQEYVDLDKILNVGGKEILTFADKVFSERMYENSAEGYEYVKTNFPDIKEITAACFGLAYSYENAGSPSEDENIGNYIFLKDALNYQEKNQYLLKAVSEYGEIINKYPDTIWALKSYYRIGEIKLNLTFDLDGAVECFTNIVNLSKDSLILREAALKIGDCMLAKGNLKLSENKYDEIIDTGKIDELYYRALYKKSFINYLNGDFSKAEEIANDIIMKQPPHSKIYNDILELLMFIEENKKDDENALHEYAEALALIEQRKYSEAVGLMEQIKDVYTNHQISDDALFMIGKLQGLMGDYVKGLDAFKELITKYPSSLLSDETQLRIGELYEVGIGDIAFAEKEYEILLVNYPNSIYIDEARKRIRNFTNN